LYRNHPNSAALDLKPTGSRRRAMLCGSIALLGWALLLGLAPLWARQRPGSGAAVFASFYRSGSLVFGGGHVVLPLLRAEVVPRGWISDDVFLAGYGAAQAVPGPLFSFAAYLGTLIPAGGGGWRGGMWAVFAIFLPGWLLLGGVFPFWDRLRRVASLRAALNGTNAAVVGILLAALYRPVWLEGITDSLHFALAAAAWGALALWRAPPWAVVIGAAIAGEILF